MNQGLDVDGAKEAVLQKDLLVALGDGENDKGDRGVDVEKERGHVLVEDVALSLRRRPAQDGGGDRLVGREVPLQQLARVVHEDDAVLEELAARHAHAFDGLLVGVDGLHIDLVELEDLGERGGDVTATHLLERRADLGQRRSHGA